MLTSMNNISVTMNEAITTMSMNNENDTNPAGNNNEPEFPFIFLKNMFGFTAACAIIISILGVTGNLLTIVALPMCKKLNTTITAYVVSLAVVQLLFCLFALPIAAVNYIHLQYQEKSFLNTLGCKYYTVISHAIAQVQLQTILGIAVTRAISIGFPVFYRKIDNRYVTTAYITFMWIYSFVIKIVKYNNFNYNPKTMRCDAEDISNEQRSLSILREITIPMCIIVVLYVFIFVMVKRSSARIKPSVIKSTLPIAVEKNPSETGCNERIKPSTTKVQNFRNMISKNTEKMLRRSSDITQHLSLNTRDTKVAKSIFIIFIIMVICFSPVTFAHAKLSDGSYPHVYLAARIFYWLSYFLNIAVYVLTNRQYRIAYIELLVKFRPSFEKHKGYLFPWEHEISKAEVVNKKHSQCHNVTTDQPMSNYGRKYETIELKKLSIDSPNNEETIIEAEIN